MATTQKTAPTILVDVPDEPLEDFCHVEKTEEIDTPEKAVAYMLADESLFDPSWYSEPSTLWPDGEARLRCENPDDEPEAQRWQPAEGLDDQVLDFWRLQRVEKEAE